MANLLDPIESVFNSMLAPLTSSPTTSTKATSVVVVQSSSTRGSTGGVSSSTSPSTSASTNAQASTTSKSTSSKSSNTNIPLTSSDTATSSSSVSSITQSASSTTLSTSTNADTTPPAPIATTLSNPLNAAPSATTSPQPAIAPSGNNVSTAGIVVAVIFAVGLLSSISWLIFRYCPPVRRRYETWSDRKQIERSYREALDGSREKENSSRPFSFFAVGQSTTGHNQYDLEAQKHASYTYSSTRIPAQPSIVHAEDRLGLGLGRVSMLRNHSLLRKAGHDIPPVPSKSRPETPLPNARMKSLPTAPRLSIVPMPLHVRRANTSTSSLPALTVQIPPTPTERRSQIGLAVTSSTPQGGTRYDRNVSC